MFKIQNVLNFNYLILFVIWSLVFVICEEHKAIALVFRVLVSIWFQVLFHRLRQPAFHLSLTVLVHYRSQDVFSLTG
jgi:hypothetical protein